MTQSVGVLALQGAFVEHIRMLESIGVPARQVRTVADLESVSALIIPGGESTTIGKLLRIGQLDGPIRERVISGMPVWGTCAGMILLGSDIGDSGSKNGEPQLLLRLMDIRVRRNAFGSQLESFEADLHAPAVADVPIHAVFIRAPVVESVGAAVQVISALPDGRAVAVRERNILATSFHPELTNDLAFHKYFVEMMNHQNESCL